MGVAIVAALSSPIALVIGAACVIGLVAVKAYKDHSAKIEQRRKTSAIYTRLGPDFGDLPSSGEETDNAAEIKKQKGSWFDIGPRRAGERNAADALAQFGIFGRSFGCSRLDAGAGPNSVTEDNSPLEL